MPIQYINIPSSEGGGGGGGTPAGAPGDVQFNLDGTSFGGDSGFTYDGAGNAAVSGDFSASTIGAGIVNGGTLKIQDTATITYASGIVSFNDGSGEFLSAGATSYGLATTSNYVLTLPNIWMATTGDRSTPPGYVNLHYDGTHFLADPANVIPFYGPPYTASIVLLGDGAGNITEAAGITASAGALTATTMNATTFNGTTFAGGAFTGDGSGLTNLPAFANQAVDTTSDVTFNTVTTTAVSSGLKPTKVYNNAGAVIVDGQAETILHGGGVIFDGTVSQLMDGGYMALDWIERSGRGKGSPGFKMLDWSGDYPGNSFAIEMGISGVLLPNGIKKDATTVAFDPGQSLVYGAGNIASVQGNERWLGASDNTTKVIAWDPAVTNAFSALYWVDSGNDSLTGSSLGLSVFVGDSGAGGAVGTVPAPATGDGAIFKTLSADGAWRLPIPNQTPTNSGDTGTAGQVVWDDDYIYVCTATDTWKRVAIATW